MDTPAQNSLDNLAELELIFVHIPKTAGATLRQILRRIYGEQAVHFSYHRAVKGKRPDIASSIPAGTRVLAGHFTFDQIKHIYDPARHRIITFVRDPVTRYVSYHFHVKKFARAPAAGLAERLRRYEPFWLYALNPRYFNLIDRHINGLAIENWDFIGRQECFEQDLATLGSVLGWDSKTSQRKRLQKLRINRNDIHPASQRRVPTALRAWVDRVNRRDAKLVQDILILRARRGWEPDQDASL